MNFTEDLANKLDGVLVEAVSDGRVTGAVICVASSDQLVYARAEGLADRELKTPLTLDTRFRYASLSKIIVSGAALALIEQGRLGLDDPVTKYLPSFRPSLADGSAPPISVRDLLRHTSGLGYTFTEAFDGPYHRAGVSDGLGEPGRSFEDNAGRLVSAPLRAVPGTEFNYSLSTDIVGEVIAQAAQDTLPNLISSLVAKPLGITSFGFFAPSADILATPYVGGVGGVTRMTDGHLVPYEESAITFAPSRALNSSSYPSGGAGLLGTARDFLTFLEAIRKGGKNILSPLGAELMTTDQLGGASREKLGNGLGFSLGAAIISDPRRANRAMSKGSLRWGGVYGHSWFIDRERSLSVVLLSTTALEGMNGQLAVDVERAIGNC